MIVSGNPSDPAASASRTEAAVVVSTKRPVARIDAARAR
ncbi:MAG: hypothetical protein JWM27_3046 [Gemmatimonadetes bacterium]|nr:hypothetical protein [Gemmatimonadota bacterium]